MLGYPRSGEAELGKVWLFSCQFDKDMACFIYFLYLVVHKMYYRTTAAATTPTLTKISLSPTTVTTTTTKMS